MAKQEGIEETMYFTIESMQVRYGKQIALDLNQPVTFEEGDRIGIIGSNGAGKSTLIKAILGLTDYKGHINTDLSRKDMAVHMQHNHYVDTMPVRYVMEAVLGTKIKKHKRAQELISFFDFEPCLGKRFSKLSGGQKQRLTIILVMLANAPLTFYDEVTSGLDFETRQRMMEKLASWYRGREGTLVVVSHYYEELEQLTDKILILDNGRLIDFGRKEELFRKYCGNSILIVDSSEENRKITAGMPYLNSPNHLIALSCRDKAAERDAVDLLLKNGINFKRSDNDIEIMSINAKTAFDPEEEGEEAAV